MKDIFLLDVDETLLDFKRGEREALSQTLDGAGMSADERVLSRFHEINDGLWKRLERGEITREKLVVLRFETLFSEFSFVGDAKRAAEEYFLQMREKAYLLAGAESFLQALSDMGRVYYVTNGSLTVQRSRLEKSGLIRYARRVFISEEVGVDKPSRLFAEAVEEGVPDYERRRAVWMGDSLTSDMLCAESAGIDFILYSPAGAPAGYCGACAENYPQALSLIGKMP